MKINAIYDDIDDKNNYKIIIFHHNTMCFFYMRFVPGTKPRMHRAPGKHLSASSEELTSPG